MSPSLGLQREGEQEAFPPPFAALAPLGPCPLEYREHLKHRSKSKPCVLCSSQVAIVRLRGTWGKKKRRKEEERKGEKVKEWERKDGREGGRERRREISRQPKQTPEDTVSPGP